MIASGDGVWLDTFPKEDLPRAGDGPLSGLTVGVKDNIDVAGLVTTAGLPSFARVAGESALAVRRLVAAGAIVVGKTNLDQLATGLVGTRSPYGIPANPIDPAFVPGGSSSGSAVAVARGDVDIALGTDTAGSGRVPAAMCGIVGIKGEPGAVPMDGVVPASPTIDCVSAFARSVHVAVTVQHAMEGRARWLGGRGPFRVGVPDAAGRSHLDDGRALAFSSDSDRLVEVGHELVPVDMQPCFVAGDLLYSGPWLADRTATIGQLLAEGGDGVVEVVRSIVGRGHLYTGVDVFNAMASLRSLERSVAAVFDIVDALVVPSVPFLPSIIDVAADPIGVNLRLGRYATFVNMLGLAAMTVPGAGAGFPSSITIVGPPSRVAVLAAVAASFTGDELPAARAPGTTEVAVVGAHLRGQPLNGQLAERGATFLARTTTAPSYRLHRLAGDAVLRPGLERVGDGGAAIEVEVWTLSHGALGALCDDVPPPLGIGSVELADGRWVRGFVCEPLGLCGATDITDHGGWRAYLASLG